MPNFIASRKREQEARSARWPKDLLAENYDSVSAGVAIARIIGKSQIRYQVILVDTHGRVPIEANVLVVVNVASVILHIEVVLERDAVCAVVVNGAIGNVGAV